MPYSPIPYVSIGNLTVSTHGLMFLLAAFVCLGLLKARLSAQEFRRLLNSIPWLTLGSLLGARFSYLISRAETDVSQWPLFWQGGMVSYGGLAGCFLVLWWRHRSEAPDYYDRLAGPCLIAWGIGRLGCLLSWYGEAGALTDVPWGLTVAGSTRHPVMGYLALLYIVGGTLLSKVKPEKPGRLWPTALFYYGLVRGICDQWRDYRPEYLGSLSQAVCGTIVILSLIVFVRAGSNPATFVETESREK